MSAILDEGYFCTECEWFETDIDFNDVVQCASCGCHRDAHVDAQVVTK